MSADNWRRCPRCLRIALEKKEHLIKKMNAQYGKISIEEFAKLKEEAEQPINLKLTFEEYYELGIFDGPKFNVTYNGSCSVCNFNFEYEHEEKVSYC